MNPYIRIFVFHIFYFLTFFSLQIHIFNLTSHLHHLIKNFLSSIGDTRYLICLSYLLCLSPFIIDHFVFLI